MVMASINSNGSASMIIDRREHDDSEQKCDTTQPPSVVGNMNVMSISERRAEKCGFRVPNMNVQKPRLTVAGIPPLYLTVPPGISPSALLDSPVMVSNTQGADSSPTTGTFEFASPDHQPFKLSPIPYSESMPHISSRQNQTLGAHSMDLQETAPWKFNGVSTTYIGENSDQKRHKGATCYPKDQMANSRCSEDGYCWRKYGQKHVKGSEYPRSYYKCSSTSCLAKKKVERSHDGHIAEIVYKGSHNHPKVLPHDDLSDYKNNEISSRSTAGNGCSAVCSDGSCSNGKAPPPTTTTSFQGYYNFDSIGKFLISSALGNQDCDDDHRIVMSSLCDGEVEESETSKRLKREMCAMDNNKSRSTREPRVVVRIQSDVDILDDGYRWRKYGQKVVKGNPNPRSYYKCTTTGCPVRKQVERAADDPKSVITTYEGKHNHPVPAHASSKTNYLPTSQQDQAAPKQRKRVRFHDDHDQAMMKPASNLHYSSSPLMINYPLSFSPFVLTNGSGRYPVLSAFDPTKYPI